MKPQTTKPLKVLISAYSCEPGKGSERGVGWGVVREMAKRHDVWVLTRPDESKDAIEAEMACNPMPNLHFVYFTLPFWQDSLRLGQSGAMQIHYYLWQIQAYFVARRLHKEIGFDLSHHVTFVKYSSPCFLSLLPIPLVWGPVGGAESAPGPFWKDFDLRARAYEWARIIVRSLGEIDPFVKLTARRSAAVRATTKDTAKKLYEMGADSVHILPESGLPDSDISTLSHYPIPINEPVKFISLGRLLHWKGFHLGVQAFAAANLPNSEYWLCGEGPEREKLEALAKDLGVGDRVKFFGLLPREACLNKLQDCHALVHPSLHDSGGWVCLEAMAAGRPVLCLDLGGPGVQVTEDVGFKVAAHTPEQVIADLAAAMKKLAENPHLCAEMGGIGRALIQKKHSWKVKGEELSQLYEKVSVNA
ncbi:MAG: glycosyltransferase family 4 protein [Cyanobacteria bacterium J06649_4]